jgi:hypothetical protein
MRTIRLEEKAMANKKLPSVVILILLGLISCSRVQNTLDPGSTVVGEKTVDGILVRRLKGSWTVGDFSFACGNHRAECERLDSLAGKHVKITGTLVEHKINCPEPQMQCRTQDYFTFEPLESIEEVKSSLED